MCDIKASSNMSQSPPKKRSIFSKQAFTKVNVAKDPVDFFSCASKVYPKLLEEKEQKRQNKIKRKERQQSEKSEESVEKKKDETKELSEENFDFKVVTTFLDGLENHPNFKSNSENNRTSISPLLGFRSSENVKKCEDKTSPQSHDVKSLRNHSIKKRKLLSLENNSKTVISIDSDNEGTPLVPSNPFENGSPSPKVSRSIIPERQNDILDEEFDEFIQQARERERLKVQQRLKTMNGSTEQKLRNPNEKVIDIFDAESEPILELDPTVELLITSEIEGTRPLRVKRKMSQRLKEARLTWCEKQHIRIDKLGRPLEEVIFFTWRGKRLFDVTTCGSLGLKVRQEGKLSLDNDGTDSVSNIHLEAWTEDTLKAKEEKALENQRLENDGSEDERKRKADEQNGPSFKLIMKAKDMEPCKLVVRPTTTIAKMIEAFRKAKAIPEDTKIIVHFDGDQLDPNSTIEQTELGDSEDVDTVEVYLK